VLVGNDKALSANLSLAEKNLRRSITRTYVPCRKNNEHILVGFCCVFWCYFTNVKATSETTKPCRKREGFVGINKALLETTKLCRKRERFAGKDKAFFGPELAKHLKSWKRHRVKRKNPLARILNKTKNSMLR
jgi:hypothetical protein